MFFHAKFSQRGAPPTWPNNRRLKLHSTRQTCLGGCCHNIGHSSTRVCFSNNLRLAIIFLYILYIVQNFHMCDLEFAISLQRRKGGKNQAIKNHLKRETTTDLKHGQVKSKNKSKINGPISMFFQHATKRYKKNVISMPSL